MGNPVKVQKIPKQPLAVKAYETLVKKIICLEYQPSQHLEENQLVEDLGIGRTPIREALVRLHGEKMVESHPKKGVIVRPITLQNTKHKKPSWPMMCLIWWRQTMHFTCILPGVPRMNFSSAR